MLEAGFATVSKGTSQASFAKAKCLVLALAASNTNSCRSWYHACPENQPKIKFQTSFKKLDGCTGIVAGITKTVANNIC